VPTEHKYPSEKPSAAKPRRAHRTSTGESPEHRDRPVGPIGRARSARITALVLRPRVAWIHSARFFLAPLRSSSDRTRRLTRPIPRSIGLTGATRDTHSRVRHTLASRRCRRRSSARRSHPNRASPPRSHRAPPTPRAAPRPGPPRIETEPRGSPTADLNSSHTLAPPQRPLHPAPAVRIPRRTSPTCTSPSARWNAPPKKLKPSA
jgi:hypothetical protein